MILLDDTVNETMSETMKKTSVLDVEYSAEEENEGTSN